MSNSKTSTKSAARKVGPVSAETGVTKYGARSNPGKGHHFSWASGTPGEGTGNCRYCECRLKFVSKGPRGGKVRQYSKDGKTFAEKEIGCDTKAHAKAA